MTCQEVIELMQRDLDHDLNEDESAILHSHLESCAGCEAAFIRMKQISEELTMLPKVNPPYSLVDEILPQLKEQTNRNVSWGRRWTQSVYVRAIGGVAAAALVLMMVFNDTPLNPLNNSFNSSMDASDMAVVMSDDAGSAEQELAPADLLTSLTTIDQYNDMNEVTRHKSNGAVKFHASDEPEYTSSFNVILQSDGQQIISPNGEYSAIINEDGTQFQIDIVSADGQTVYSSRTFEAEQLSNLHWSEDSKYFHYEIVSADVTSKASISIE